MVGFKVEYDEIVIKPCLPKAWKEINYKRVYNGCCYDITVKNNPGEKMFKVDGKVQEGNSIPKYNDGKTHKIEICI